LLAAIPEVQITLAADLTLLPLPAAHEEFKQDVLGHHHFLGFMLSAAGYQIYHSGDSIPFAGLEDRLRKLDCELALLPVNGRDAFRKSQGIPGNFTLEEAIALCRQAEIRTMVAHHFGMFDFNTVAPEAIDEAANKRGEVVQVIRPRTSRRYLLRSRKEI
jgi:L-ascorbate metabolism protein UlaG (beta-lactamase superfamily)